MTDHLTDKFKCLVLCEQHQKNMTDNIIHANGDVDFESDELLRSLICNTSRSIYFSNEELIEMFLCNRVFTDANARLVLSQTQQGRNFLFKPKVSEIIKTAIQTCKLMVFQESGEDRLHRAKQYYLRTSSDYSFEEQVTKLKLWLSNNNIDHKDFSTTTHAHFHQKTGKRNNLFFYGPPSTGKSMIMESLLTCHYNYTRLTGLVDYSPFNFSSLIHSNACFMDEIKVTDSHFEQWKLIAAGLPCSTDVKYHEKSDITNCVLYTCSNYEISSHCRVPECESAIETRTHTFKITAPCEEFFCVSPQAWEMFWLENNSEK